MSSLFSVGSPIPSHEQQQYRLQVGLETDIGGGRENQDDCFVWMRKEMLVMCVLDGHVKYF